MSEEISARKERLGRRLKLVGNVLSITSCASMMAVPVCNLIVPGSVKFSDVMDVVFGITITQATLGFAFTMMGLKLSPPSPAEVERARELRRRVFRPKTLGDWLVTTSLVVGLIGTSVCIYGLVSGVRAFDQFGEVGVTSDSMTLLILTLKSGVRTAGLGAIGGLGSAAILAVVGVALQRRERHGAAKD